MGVVAIGMKEFQQTVEKSGVVLVDWWAPWCGPCRSFAPSFEAVSEANPDVTFVKVNTDEEQELASAFQIRSIPTLMVFRDQVLLYSQPGALPRSALEELLGKVRDIDMEAVRAEIAKAQNDGLPQP
jgi:thioredoxin